MSLFAPDPLTLMLTPLIVVPSLWRLTALLLPPLLRVFQSLSDPPSLLPALERSILITLVDVIVGSSLTACTRIVEVAVAVRAPPLPVLP